MRPPSEHVFQSLSCWNGKLNPAVLFYFFCPFYLFQSLSCWNGKLNLTFPLREPAGCLFQSLSCWNGKLNGQFGKQRRIHPGVSILVLLEWEIKLQGAGSAFREIFVSILVLLEWEIKPRPRARWNSPSSCFNPCLVGMGN